MTEKDLIRQLKELREIQPRKDWVVLTKKRIFNQDPQFEAKMGFTLFPLFNKLALAPVISVLIIIGLLGFAQHTVPGDFFFSLKKVTESAQVKLSSEIQKPEAHLKLANKRLEELTKIAEADHRVENLAPAIEEFQANMAQATKGLVKMGVNVTSSDSMVIKGIVDESQKLGENKQKIEALGIVIGETEELDSALRKLEKQTAAILIEDLESRTLSEDDQKLLEEAKQAFGGGNYSLALEKIWTLSNK